MPLFACARCSTVDNTALTDYWIQQQEYFERNSSIVGFEGLCTECRTGKWHGEFPRQTVSKSRYVRDPKTPNFLMEDPRDKEHAKTFNSLIASCSASEQHRIIEGIQAGYFSATPKLDAAPSAISHLPEPNGLKKRKQNG